MLWKNWLINRLGSLVIVAGPRQARFFHGPVLHLHCIIKIGLLKFVGSFNFTIF